MKKSDHHRRPRPPQRPDRQRPRPQRPEGGCKQYKKNPRKGPKCNEQEGCKWVVGKGCEKDEHQGHAPQRPPAPAEHDDHPVIVQEINCRKFRKGKKPKM